jgi:hypothetical protein
MKAQFENRVMSSLLLFVDHHLLNKGEAYTNYSGLLYPTDNLYNNYYTYSAPFKQMVSDDSIPGATVMKNVYVNGGQTSVGGELHGINHYNGQVYFTADKSSSVISGNYSIKDFNVYLTNDPESKLLFETKYHLNSKYPQQLSGLAPDTQPYPAVFVKNMGGTNDPFAFGGLDNTITNARLVVLADSNYKLDAACSIFKDLKNKSVPIINDLPFDALGSYTGLAYDYVSLATGAGPLIWDVRVSKVSMMGDFERLNPDVFSAFVDLELSSIRTHS